MKLTLFGRLLALLIFIGVPFFLVKQCYFPKKIAYNQDSKSLSRFLSKELSISGKRNVAVLDFVNNNNKADNVGEYLAQDLSTFLIQDKETFRVLDRSRLDLLIEEQRLKATGLLDEKTVARIGKVIGLDAVVIGKYHIIGKELKLWLRIIDISTAEILTAAEKKINIDNELEYVIESNY